MPRRDGRRRPSRRPVAARRRSSAGDRSTTARSTGAAAAARRRTAATRSEPSGARPAGSARSASRSSAAGCAAGGRSSILTLYLVLLGRLRLDGRADHGADLRRRGFGGNAAFATAAIGQGIFVALLMLETLLVVVPRPDGDGRRDQPRAREADPRDAGRDADHVGRDRRRQAAERADLRLAADRRLDPADGDRLRVRRRRARTTSCAATLVLIVTALGLGAFGLFCSSLVKRTQAATAITIFGVLALSIGLAVRRSCSGHGAGRPPDRGSRDSARSRARRPSVAHLPQPVPRPGRRAPTEALCGDRLGAALLLPVQRDVPARPERGHLRQRLGLDRAVRIDRGAAAAGRNRPASVRRSRSCRPSQRRRRARSSGGNPVIVGDGRPVRGRR